jgi:hypothetical protein
MGWPCGNVGRSCTPMLPAVEVDSQVVAARGPRSRSTPSSRCDASSRESDDEGPGRGDELKVTREAPTSRSELWPPINARELPWPPINARELPWPTPSAQVVPVGARWEGCESCANDEPAAAAAAAAAAAGSPPSAAARRAAAAGPKEGFFVPQMSHRRKDTSFICGRHAGSATCIERE